jgi:ABC-2 type transport system ATP-binding protein
MLSGILRPSSGKGEVAGFDIEREPEEVKKKIGYMSQKFSLYSDLTVAENIRFFGGIYELKPAKLKERTEWVIEMADLHDKQKTLTRALSAGWKQRLALGCAILHEPGIVFLDEPTGGVDPVSRRSFWELINNLSSRGTTVLVTTHYLDEAEYCNEVFLMHGGRIIEQGNPHRLKTEVLEGVMLEIVCDEPVRAMEVLNQDARVLGTSIFGTKLHVHVNAKSEKTQVREALSERHIRVYAVSAIIPSLEDVFIALISAGGKKIHAEH